jgi:hypothetical protein
MQYLKTFASNIYVIQLLVIYDRRGNVYLVNPPWETYLGRNLAYRKNDFILFSQMRFLLSNYLFLNKSIMLKRKNERKSHMFSDNFNMVHCFKTSLSSDLLSLLVLLS